MSADDWGAPPASPADYGTSRGPVTQTTDVRMPARIDLRRTDDRWPFAQGADSSRSTRASPATANSGGARAGRATAGRLLAAGVLVSIFGCLSSAFLAASRLGLPMSADAPAFLGYTTV